LIPVYYDLHIHTALSPCANDDMSPNDIVRMALLNGLDMIAVTDHNTFANAESVVKAAKTTQEQNGKELIVLPGIEVSTAEEVHVLCLFHDVESALKFDSELFPYFSGLLNRIHIFGNQIIYDENDQITGELERMLIAPASISFDNLFHLVHKHEGAFIPAHIDRNSFSLLSNLGFLPPHLDINTLEISQKGASDGFCEQNKDEYIKNKIIISSDAHQLWTLNERENYLLLPEKNSRAAIDYLR
jgi:hypothetical protein